MDRTRYYVVFFLIWTLMITIPLLILGGILGYVFRSEFQAPGATPSQIQPLALYRRTQKQLGGLLPFRAISIDELHYIYTSLWWGGHKIYTICSILFIMFVILKIHKIIINLIKKMKKKESVWGNFIPSIYLEIISGKPVLIDDDSKSFGIEKRSGKICFMLGARALSIIWGNNPTYWTWRPSNESRFPEVAKLLNVCWLEITGKVETRMLSPKTMYGAYFVIKTAEQNSGLDTVPVQFSMRFVRGGGECSEARKVFLKRREMQQQREFPHERGDGWMEIEMGEFYNDGEEDGEVEMHLLDTSGHWKRGLIVQGMELRPKGNATTTTIVSTQERGWMEIEMGEFYNDGEEDGEVEMHLLDTSGHWKGGLIVQDFKGWSLGLK